MSASSFFGKNSSEAQSLLEGIVRKDPKSLGKFYDLYGSMLYSVIYKILMNREEAEEILQEVFTILWNKADQFKPERSSPLTWMTTIARNAAVSKLRSSDYKNRKQSTEYQEIFTEKPGVVRDSVFQAAMDSSLRVRVREAIASLAPEISILLQEAYWSGLSQSEIAEKYKLPLGTVKSRIRTGLLELRDKLKDWS
ncbi:sigma-70 family RNA polymerase sigma factor [Leptospira yasudae]|uniref:Sigma-70 family RNA polymerase sigma factor n=1 Tax=Leptospira yasudae TaxID=2202201 RepID=A0A6N4QKS5_9LEPT|nr:sigma-70 family RNA polymerase sigma factor [Leptospira yasudae]TGL76064.1 sigma-70 family RNA polymerase sigma factor [Leptospira yasudae]TGL83530.1 sigma-70 family RNA polymerase sigma factor [Leptospira yasudae]TGL85434.1 sigma-70 family RNA polymerase sigma factor [Leptospira yasudae]